MDGCLICGVRHIGSCRPDHPAHRPLSAEEWAEREARAAEQQPAQSKMVPPRWETLKERVGAWFSRGEATEAKPGPAPVLDGPPESEPVTPGERRWPILCRAEAVSPGDTIEPAVGKWYTVVELGPPETPHPNHADIRPYGTRLEAGEQWQTAYCRAATQPEIAAAQTAQREQSELPRPLDIPTPGPIENSGGSFQVFHSKDAADDHIKSLPPSQIGRLDRIMDADGSTAAYGVTTHPSPSRGEEQAGRAALAFVTEHRERVEAAVAALKDPAARAKAEHLLQTIREEAAAREQTPSRAQEQEVELER